jgi:hypothetical protein
MGNLQPRDACMHACMFWSGKCAGIRTHRSSPQQHIAGTATAAMRVITGFSETFGEVFSARL